MGKVIDPLNLGIGLRVKELREKNKWSQYDLAEKAGVSAQFIYFVETGQRGLSSRTIRELSSVFSVTTDYILFGRDDTERSLEYAAQAFASFTNKERIAAADILIKVAEAARRYEDDEKQ